MLAALREGIEAPVEFPPEAIAEAQAASAATPGLDLRDVPFVTLDREADMREAYAHFERLLEERS